MSRHRAKPARKPRGRRVEADVPMWVIATDWYYSAANEGGAAFFVDVRARERDGQTQVFVPTVGWMDAGDFPVEHMGDGEIAAVVTQTREDTACTLGFGSTAAEAMSMALVGFGQHFIQTVGAGRAKLIAERAIAASPGLLDMTEATLFEDGMVKGR